MPSSEPNFDAKMVDWLYDELDPSEVESFEKHLEANPAAQAEAAALKRTREAFRELDQSEPPPALSAILMHEAAKSVQQSPGLWARFAGLFQPIFLHPAVSAMATLVIVAGVAGALYSRHGDMAYEPKASVNASMGEAAPAEELPAAANLPSTLQGLTAMEDSESALANEVGDDLAESESDLPGNDGYRVGMANKATEGAIQSAADSRNARRFDDDNSNSNAWGSGKGGGGSASDSSARPEYKAPAQGMLGGANTIAISGGRGYASSPPPPPSAKPKPEPSVQTAKSKRSRKSPASKKRDFAAPSEKAAEERAPVAREANKEQKDKAGSWEDQKRSVLNAAAKSKRCREAGRIANDILDKKPAYYNRKVKNSQAVSDCGSYVASETKRRAKRRSKQAANARKKAAGTPKKAKAAPRKTDYNSALD